jgi:hypothetical protein
VRFHGLYLDFPAAVSTIAADIIVIVIVLSPAYPKGAKVKEKLARGMIFYSGSGADSTGQGTNVRIATVKTTETTHLLQAWTEGDEKALRTVNPSRLQRVAPHHRQLYVRTNVAAQAA